MVVALQTAVMRFLEDNTPRTARPAREADRQTGTTT